MSNPKYPEITARLVGENGNAFHKIYFSSTLYLMNIIDTILVEVKVK